MVNLQNLEFIGFTRWQRGVLVTARYQDWQQKYSFFIQADGNIKGKTSNGYWYELSQEATDIVRAKIWQLIAQQALPVS